MSSHLRWICLLLVACLAPSLACAKQLAVVVDKSNSTASVPSADLAKIFKSEMRAWPDGRGITVVIRDPASPEMQLALQKLYKMSADELKALISTKKGSIIIADSDESLLRVVGATRGAIGLIDVYSITKDINVLRVDGKLPLEQGYLLRGN